MTEIRCVKCGRLLFKANETFGMLEIKCSKCGYINKIGLITNINVKPKKPKMEFDAKEVFLTK